MPDFGLRARASAAKLILLYTYEGTTIGDDRNIVVCKDLEACFYRVGILFRQFQTSLPEYALKYALEYSVASKLKAETT